MRRWVRRDGQAGGTCRLVCSAAQDALLAGLYVVAHTEFNNYNLCARAVERKLEELAMTGLRLACSPRSERASWFTGAAPAQGRTGQTPHRRDERHGADGDGRACRASRGRTGVSDALRPRTLRASWHCSRSTPLSVPSRTRMTSRYKRRAGVVNASPRTSLGPRRRRRRRHDQQASL